MKKEKEMKLNSEAEEFKREELLGRYIAKLLYGWDDKNFDEEYLEKNWNKWKNERKEGEKEYMKKLEESLDVQNSVGSLVLYNELNSTKSLQLFHFI